MTTARIGLVSDSHGRFCCLEQMVDQAPDVCCWIHGGDYCNDAEDLAAYAAVPVYAVLGNNDYLTDMNVPERRTVKAAGLTIAVIQGSQWYGKNGSENWRNGGTVPELTWSYSVIRTASINWNGMALSLSIPAVSAAPETGEKGLTPSSRQKMAG